MSWSEDRLCLSCGGKVPLYRRLREEQFCTDAHREQYLKDQQELALLRLHEVHVSLPPSLEAPHGEAPQVEEQELEHVSSLAYHSTSDYAGQHRSRTDPRRQVSGRASVAALPAAETPDEDDSEALDEALANAFSEARSEVESDLPLDALSQSLSQSVTPSLPVAHDAFPELLPESFSEAVQESEIDSQLYEQSLASRAGDFAHAPQPPSEVIFAAEHEAEPEPAPEIVEWIPPFAELLAEGTIYFADTQFERTLSAAQPEPANWAIVFPLMPWEMATALADDLHDLEQIRIEESAPLMLDAMMALDLPRLAPLPRPRLISSAVTHLGIGQPAEGLLAPVLELELAVGSSGIKLFSIPFSARPLGANSQDFLRTNLELDATPRTPPHYPRLKIEVAADSSHKGLRGLARLGGRLTSASGITAWKNATDFWQNAPRDLKILAVAIPFLLALALHPSLPKFSIKASKQAAAAEPMAARVSAPPSNQVFGKVPAPVNLPVSIVNTTVENTTEAAPVLAADPPSGTGGVIETRWSIFKQRLSERAAIDLSEDFRSGLDDWISAAPLETHWTFDQTGFVHPVEMALYKPTVGMTDYEFRFLAMIDKKALNWVVRAKDFNNYYAIRLYIAKPGPVPELRLSRRPVLDGKAGTAVDTVVPISARVDTIYRISMKVTGDDFSVTVQDTLVDAWSDARFARGGIGFHSPKGDASRVRWAQVTHQSDMVGRICAYFAPPELSATNFQNSSLKIAGGAVRP